MLISYCSDRASPSSADAQNRFFTINCLDKYYTKYYTMIWGINQTDSTFNYPIPPIYNPADVESSSKKKRKRFEKILNHPTNYLGINTMATDCMWRNA